MSIMVMARLSLVCAVLGLAAASSPQAIHAASSPQAIQYGKYYWYSGGARDRSINTLYLFTPPAGPGPGPHPFVLQVHGGGFTSGGATMQASAEIQSYLDNGIAYASINYRLVGQSYYYDGGNGTAEQPVDIEEEMVDIAEDGSLTLSQTRTASAQRVLTGNQELIGKCVFDAARALEALLSRAPELGIDPARVGFAGGSAGGAEILYLALVYPFLNSSAGVAAGAGGRANLERYTPRSVAYSMTQIDYPLPMLDRGWSLWAEDLGEGTALHEVLSQQDCAAVVGNSAQWCTRAQDCNATWSDRQVVRFCGSDAAFRGATLGALRDSYTWPLDTPFRRGLTRLWHHSKNLAALPPAFAQGLYVLTSTSRNGTDAMSIVHSSLWARQYAKFGAASGVQFATYYTDYHGMTAADKGDQRVEVAAGGGGRGPAHGPTVYNYKSSFGWRGLLPAAAAHAPPGGAVEALLLHCHAFNVSCHVAPSPPPPPSPPSPSPTTAPLSSACKQALRASCGPAFGDSAQCNTCIRGARAALKAACNEPLTAVGGRLIGECFVQDTAAHGGCRDTVTSACSGAFGDAAACARCVHGHAQGLIAACGNDQSGGDVTAAWCASQLPHALSARDDPPPTCHQCALQGRCTELQQYCQGCSYDPSTTAPCMGGGCCCNC